MKFIEMRDQLIAHFTEMVSGIGHLYEVHLNKDVLWDTYLDSFPKGTNEIYKTNRKYDCNCCKSFIKAVGNVVTIKDNVITTIWDFETNEVFQPVVDSLSEFVKSHVISDVHFFPESIIGTKENFKMEEDTDSPIKFSHFYLNIPSRFVRDGESINSSKSHYRDIRNVFKRSLDEITEEAVSTVLDLILSNSLYKGEEWNSIITTFLKYKKEYMNLADEYKDIYTWEKCMEVGSSVGKIRNHSIGTLLVNISEGMDLETAVKKYEVIVAPYNYKRSKPIFTQRMLEDAKKTVTELGYMDSLARRYAKLDDISVNDILFSNKDAAGKITEPKDIFGEIEKAICINPKKFANVEEIYIDKFISDVLPTANTLEVLLENQHKNNMVSLIAPEVAESKSMFKWDNGFSWAYAGNNTDSLMKERVKKAGGKVDGVLRYSIQWNDLDAYSGNDLDAHCITPNGTRIYFGDDLDILTQGNLDVDIRHPRHGEPAVENITWPDKERMTPGVYKFMVHQFQYRGGNDGFRAEIEFNGEIHSFNYANRVNQDKYIEVAEVTLDENGNFSIKELLPSNSTVASHEVWNLHTNQFVPVSVVCYSPNFWSNSVGHRHTFFMLKDCKNPEEPNGFYNEFLKDELYHSHRKVFEALGNKAKVSYTDNQLSGIGFSMTKRAELVVKINANKVLRIKF